MLAANVRSVRDDALHDLVMRELLGMVNVADVVHRLVTDHPDLIDVQEARVRTMLADHPAVWWRSSVSGLVRADINDAADDLSETIRAQFAEQLRASNDDTDETGESR